jgi:hypothetical protein
MKFEIVGRIANVEVIASGSGVHVRRFLRKAYGSGRWRKLKGIATVRLPNGALRRGEIHRYEAHGIGRRDVRIKEVLEEL